MYVDDITTITYLVTWARYWSTFILYNIKIDLPQSKKDMIQVYSRSNTHTTCMSGCWMIIQRVRPYVVIAGLHGRSRLDTVKINHAMLTAVIEWPRQKNHIFHLPVGEAIVTLQDVVVSLRLQIDNRAITSPAIAWLARHLLRDIEFNAWCPFTWPSRFKTLMAPRALWRWNPIWCHRGCRAIVRTSLYFDVMGRYPSRVLYS